MVQFNHPFQIDKGGRTATVGEEEHVKQLMEQVLFTVQGERVNVPDFGTGINQLIFAPNSDELSAAVQLMVQGALQNWLGEFIKVESVDAKSRESTLTVHVQYIVRRNGQQQTTAFVKEF